MKNVFKASSLLIVFALILCSFSITTFAATPTLTANGGTVTNGNDITVTITLSASSNAAGGNFTLQYDNSKLTPSTYTPGGLVSGYTTNCNLNYSSNSIRFTFSGTNAITSSGTLVSIKFTTKATGSSSLNFTASKLYDINGSSISSTTSSGTVTINSDTPSTYTLSYNANGGSGAPSSQTGSTTYTISSTKPTRPGYTFLGWSKSSSATSASYTSGNIITLTANTTLYAVWKINQNPTISVSSGTVTNGNSITVNITITSSSNAAGGNFTLQYDNSKLTPSTYTPGSLVSGYTTNCNLNYSSNTIRFTFSGTNAITTSGTLVSIKFSTKATGSSSLTFAESKLYDINGSSISSMTSSGTVTINPSTPSTYTLSYNANGGSGAPSSQNLATNNTISSTIPSKFSYTFIGWSTSSSATSASYTPGNTISANSNITLYAVWKPAQTISVNSTKNISISFEGQEVYLKFTPSSTAFYYLDYSFPFQAEYDIYDDTQTNWAWFCPGSSSDVGFTRYKYTGGKTYYIRVKSVGSATGTLQLTIKVDNRAYTLTYDANFGTNAPSTQSGDIDYYISQNKPKREGYYFLGWSKDRNAKEATYQPNQFISLSENTTLYAVWRENIVLPEYAYIKNNPGTKTVDYKNYLILKADSTILGSEELVWYVDGTFAGRGSEIEIKATEDCEVSVYVEHFMEDHPDSKNTEQIKVNKNIFKKIIAFFRELFGIKKTIEQ